MVNKFRPAAVPLITVDPYFSIWSAHDNLNDGGTTHWTGKKNSLEGVVSIDGKKYVFMGAVKAGEDYLIQEEVRVEPLTTCYRFFGGGIRLELRFTTPLLLYKTAVASRPVTYVSYEIVSMDGRPHQLQLLMEATSELCTFRKNQKCLGEMKTLANGMKLAKLGRKNQAVLQKSGDDVRIDWGYLYFGAPAGYGEQFQLYVGKSHREELGTLTEHQIDADTGTLNQATPCSVISAVIKGGTALSADEERKGVLLMAYDDIQSVEYFHKPLKAYWRQSENDFEKMLEQSAAEYNDIVNECDVFDRSLLDKAEEVGGSEYADLIGLSFRQAAAAHKMVTGPEGELLYFSKECFSNGCMATVDVTYPSIPMFLLYNTELVKGMLRPIFEYARSDEWKFPFAPHDVGCYPKANGQVYGDNKLEYQMPVEECGNMLITVAAVCLRDGNPGFAEPYFELLQIWADYLLQNGFDPGNQLCTDDFAGHLAHNANLSIKAILGIASFGALCRMLGLAEQAQRYDESAKQLASQWEENSRVEDHYALTFDTKDTWSLKYNLVWDKLLGFHLFDDKIMEKELAYYESRLNRYGVPLDSRESYTKVDWELWVASMAGSREQFMRFVEPIWDFVNETSSRVPFTDWYDTKTGKQIGFQNRTVLGGIFIRLLSHELFKTAK